MNAMKTPANWAQNLTRQLTTRMALIQLHTCYRVQQNGGHRIAQEYAARCAIETLLDGGSAANAIAKGVSEGMKINTLVNTLKYLKVNEQNGTR